MLGSIQSLSPWQTHAAAQQQVSRVAHPALHNLQLLCCLMKMRRCMTQATYLQLPPKAAPCRQALHYISIHLIKHHTSILPLDGHALTAG